MEFDDVMLGRRSIRAYREDAVALDEVREVLEFARWSPSWGNAQEWNVHVVSGAALRRLCDAVADASAAGAATRPDIPMPTEWPDHLRERMSVRSAGRPAAPAQSLSTVWRAWGAPVLLLLSVEEHLSQEYACFDTGAFVQSLCLAAYARGLSTCVEAMMVRYPRVLHELLPGANGQNFVVGVALGRADEGAPANTTERGRVDLGEIVRWVE